MDCHVLIKTALDCGADKAELIDSSKLVCSDSFRAYCEENVCGFFGKCWSCPPDIGEIEALTAQLKDYDHIVIYQIISPIKDNYDTDGINAAGEKLSEVSQKLQLYLRTSFNKPFLHLGGSCHLCPECTKVSNEPCRYPDKMLPSLSAYGIDVCKTCEGTSLMYVNGENTITYFGMILFNK